MTALATTPTVFETLPQTMYLKETISAAATSLKLDYVPLAMTAGVLILDEGLANEERISFNGVTDNGDDTATFSDLGRGLAYGGGTIYAAGGATAYAHTANSGTARLVIAHEYMNKTFFIDRDNTIATGKKIYLGDTGNYIMGTAAGDISFASNTTAVKTLAQLAAAAGTDEKIKVSIDDTTASYLSTKLTGGDGITVTETDPAGNETLDIDVELATSGGLEFSTGKLKLTDAMLNAAPPTGAIMLWTTDTAPTGWLLCYGQVVSQTTYAALYAIIGHTYAADPGSGNFTLPDLRGRLPLGKDNMGGSSANRVTDTDADTLGGADGDETKTIGTTNLPSHTHTYGYQGGGAQSGIVLAAAGNATLSAAAGTTSATGDGTAMDIMPPFVTLNYIIKT